MQKELLARLRVLSRQAGDSGTPEQLEKALTRFSEDLDLSINPRLLKTLEDAEVRVIYRKWCQHILSGYCREDILDWLALAPVNPFREPVVSPADAPESTVVSLFNR